MLSRLLLHLVLDTSGFPHLHTTLLPHLSPTPCYSRVPTFVPMSSPSAFTHPCIPVCNTPCVMMPAAPMPVLDTPIPTAHPSSFILTPIMCSCDLTHATLWDMRCVCTHVHPRANWVLPTVHQILWDEIHCAVMSCSTSYHWLLRSNCKFHFNSMRPNTLAYLPSPISQNHLSISARCSPCLCSI